ncbi:MAG: DsbA family protein [Pseudomonadota bacterium]
MRAHRRRTLLVFALLGAGMLSLPRLLQRGPAASADKELQGFRRMETGDISAQFNPFVGLDSSPDGLPASIAPRDLCAALFADAASPLPQVAYFTDVNCPQCRIMDRWLYTIGSQEAEITIHDLPYLGPSSVAAARAIQAAAQFGAGSAMRTRLNRTRFAAEKAYLAEVAHGMGLNAEALVAATTSPAVKQQIGEALGLGKELRLPGTPSLVIGDMIVVGRIDEATFGRLLREYRPPPCAAQRS